MAMDHEVLRVDFTKLVALFPLPDCVLLPHTTIPLHIFEARYRSMANDSLDSSGLIAMASFRGTSLAEQAEDHPPLRPYVCVGHIVKHQRLDDGRYHILLQGVCRARIVKEIDDRPYRQAILEPAETDITMEIDLEDHRQRIDGLLGDRLLKSLKSVNVIHNWLSREVPTTAVIDLAIMMLCDDFEQRYEMLAETDVIRRAKWLNRLLLDLHQTLVIADRMGTGETADGIQLN